MNIELYRKTELSPYMHYCQSYIANSDVILAKWNSAYGFVYIQKLLFVSEIV